MTPTMDQRSLAVVAWLEWFCVLKQQTAYERRMSDWSADVSSSELRATVPPPPPLLGRAAAQARKRPFPDPHSRPRGSLRPISGSSRTANAWPRPDESRPCRRSSRPYHRTTSPRGSQAPRHRVPRPPPRPRASLVPPVPFRPNSFLPPPPPRPRSGSHPPPISFPPPAPHPP